MNVSSILGLILTACGILTFAYKVWAEFSSRLGANKARVDDLREGLEAHDEVLDEIIYYLSIPEKDRPPFNNRAALKNLRRKTLENYDSRNTSGFN
jgi:hypothetical protein